MKAYSVEEVLRLFEDYGTDLYDETVTQLDHALQTAAHARSDGADQSLVAAALLHDVGHLLDLAGMLRGRDTDRGGEAQGGGGADSVGEVDSVGGVDLKHEQTGSAYLAAIFPPAVTGPIALHVRAKRYLCATRHGYFDGLSAGSVASLARQGGPMTDIEASSFERNPASASAVRLRHWDDLGKVEGIEVPGLGEYRELLLSVATM
ncbi:MAG: hypothetical protein WBA45_05935 [Microthrixaceae bacterium]